MTQLQEGQLNQGVWGEEDQSRKSLRPPSMEPFAGNGEETFIKSYHKRSK